MIRVNTPRVQLRQAGSERTVDARLTSVSQSGMAYRQLAGEGRRTALGGTRRDSDYFRIGLRFCPWLQQTKGAGRQLATPTQVLVPIASKVAYL